MLDEKTRALLGDREAQEAITARGELLPCPICGGIPTMVCFEKRGIPYGDMGYLAEIKCPECLAELRRWALEKSWAKESAIKGWSHRPPLLTPTQMAVLGIAREPRNLEVDVNVDDA